MALPPQTRLTDDERANLVAFLDGEVDDGLAERIEQKVERSVSVRRELEALEKTWGMLDWLPRVEVPDDFASKTITRIHTQQQHAEVFESRVKRGAALVVRAAAWAACLFMMASAGFALIRFAWNDPTRQLIEDLEIAESLEAFRAIPDLKFLDDLNRLGMFVEAAPSAGSPPGESPPNDAAQGLVPGP